MILYGLVNPDNQITQITAYADPTVSTKPGWRWLLVVEDPAPSYDAALQYLNRFQEVEETRIHCWYEVQNKTEEQIQQEKTNIVENMDSFIFRILHDQENRFRSSLSQPQLTETEYKEFLRDFA